jgi:molybdenum cofactor cytidylyltransferase
MSVAAIIAAAGSSSRLGRPKQLLIHDGEPLLQRAIRIASEAGASPVLVVLGAHRELIEPHVNFGSARIIGNPEWQEGLAASIRAGVLALQSEPRPTSGVLLMICDQPRLNTAHLATMLQRFHASDHHSAIASVYAGKRGIPAIFPCFAFSQLLALQGDKGARGLLETAPWPVIEVPLEGGEIDIDKPEDLPNLEGSA